MDMTRAWRLGLLAMHYWCWPGCRRRGGRLILADVQTAVARAILVRVSLRFLVTKGGPVVPMSAPPFPPCDASTVGQSCGLGLGTCTETGENYYSCVQCTSANAGAYCLLQWTVGSFGEYPESDSGTCTQVTVFKRAGRLICREGRLINVVASIPLTLTRGGKESSACVSASWAASSISTTP